MDDTADTAQVIIRPPLAWGLAVIAGLALNWLVPLPFLRLDLPAGWLGAIVFVLALALVAWAIVTITKADSNVPTNLPTTTIVESGPYRFTRNPIYLGMFLGLIGLAIAFDNLRLLMMLVPSRSSSARGTAIFTPCSERGPLQHLELCKRTPLGGGTPSICAVVYCPGFDCPRFALSSWLLLGFYANKSPARMGDEPVEEGAAGFELRDGDVLVDLVIVPMVPSLRSEEAPP
jgi:Phospholipid methyltransferase